MTANAMNDGTSAWPRLNTYPRSWMVAMMLAYVDGRPMPSSSSALTSDASVYRAGGWVTCPVGRSASARNGWSLTTVGSRRSASSASASSSSLDSTYARRKPGSVIVLPLAPKSASSQVEETELMRPATGMQTQ